jgi:hypothetical protein
MVVELLALDLETCGRCTGTESNVEAAVAALRPVLAEAGVALEFRRTVISTADRAVAERFVSSPTVRINGRDLAVGLKETPCTDCGELCGGRSPGQIACRVWDWAGKEHTAAPKGLIVDAILRAYGTAGVPVSESAEAPFELPENLKSFFLARSNVGSAPSSPCCGSGGQAPLPTVMVAKHAEMRSGAPCCGGSTAAAPANPTQAAVSDKPCCEPAAKSAAPCCAEAVAKPAVPCCAEPKPAAPCCAEAVKPMSSCCAAAQPEAQLCCGRERGPEGCCIPVRSAAQTCCGVSIGPFVDCCPPGCCGG